MSGAAAFNLAWPQYGRFIEPFLHYNGQEYCAVSNLRPMSLNFWQSREPKCQRVSNIKLEEDYQPGTIVR